MTRAGSSAELRTDATEADESGTGPESGAVLISGPSSPRHPAAIPLRSGDTIAEKYVIDEVIGVGGIAYVVSAKHVALGEKFALKFLLPEFVRHDEAVTRFAREARLAAKIRSEHVVRVFDVGNLPDSTPYIVMELLEGRDLNRLIAGQGALPIDKAVAYVLQACEALAAAHARHIVHRDVKPDNLFLTRREDGSDCIKVLDFGISKVELTALTSGGMPSRVHTPTALGAPSYMSPEQVRAAPDIDSRADVWSLGCVLYELLVCKHVFDAPSVMQLCAAVLEREPPRLRNARPDAPEELEAIILRCLEKDRDARYQTVADLAAALRPFAPREALPSIERTFAVLARAGITAGEAASPSPSERPVAARRFRFRPLDIAAVVAIVCAGGLLVREMTNARSVDAAALATLGTAPHGAALEGPPLPGVVPVEPPTLAAVMDELPLAERELKRASKSAGSHKESADEPVDEDEAFARALATATKDLPGSKKSKEKSSEPSSPSAPSKRDLPSSGLPTADTTAEFPAP